MQFNYQVRTKDGKLQSGTIEASSKEAASVLLQKHGFYVTLLDPSDSRPVYAKNIGFFERVSRKEIVIFSRQLSIMFKSKVPLIESLQTIGKQTKSPLFKTKILEISEDVEGGTPFSRALSSHPKLFSSFYISMIKSGEISGSLSESLNYLADYLEREYDLNSQIKGALIYPFLVLSVTLGVVGLMVFFVIPQLGKVLMESGQDIPLVTKIVINGSYFLKKWLFLLILILIILIIAGIKYYFSAKGKRFFDKFFLRVPVLSTFLKLLYVSRFADNLSTLITGGLPISTALASTAPIVGNQYYRRAILEMQKEVKKGKPISSVLKKNQDLFPLIFIQMVVVGERTGSLDIALKDIGGFYEKEVERSIDNLLSVIQPILIIFLGAVVGGLMLALLMPMYQMVSF